MATEKILIRANSLDVRDLVDGVVEYLRNHDYPYMLAQPVMFIKDGTSNVFWDKWFVTRTMQDYIIHTFDVMVARGQFLRSPKGVAYRSMSERDATFRLGAFVYFISL